MISEVKNIDCMLAMKEFPDKFFELAIVDPPYGIGESKKTQSRPVIHPTQKPIEIYKWIYCAYLKKMPFNVFDSHLGGGGHRIVADLMGIEFYGTELDKDYFDASVKRFEQFKAQTKLFA